MLTTTLQAIKDYGPCEDGWKKLRKNIGVGKPLSTVVTLAQILESNGLDDAIWALRAFPENEREARLFACACACRVAHLNPDARVRRAIETASLFADGLADEQELAAARAAAWDAARDAAMNDAASDAASDAARAATRAATWDATRAATEAATWAATWDDLREWYVVPANMKAVAHAIGVGDFGLQCAAFAWKMWQGGNQWSGYDSYLSFFRHVAGLPLDYSKWDAWEILSLHSGPRIVHDDFCMISDRPSLLTVDEQSRPHADAGPFCRWRDGTALYSVHGTRVPAWIIEQTDRLTVAAIDAEQNAEVRRVMMERYGLPRYLRDAGAARIDHDERWGTLYRREIADDEPLVMIEVINRSPEPDGSFRHYTLRVPPTCTTALEAVAWTFDIPPAEYATLGAES